MIMRLRSFAKKTIPLAVIDQIRGLRDYYVLRSLPPVKLKTDNLLSDKDFNAAEIFKNIDNFDSVHDKISHLVGEKNISEGVNPGDRKAIYALIRALKPRSVLEVGTHIGMSSYYIAAALQKNGDGKLTSVDIINVNAQNAPWKDKGLPGPPQDVLQKLALKPYVTFEAGAALRYLHHTEQTFDLIFLDGDHAALSVYQEIPAALNQLNEGGLILLHDYYPDGKALFPDGRRITGPYEAARKLCRDTPNLKILPLSPLPWETKQGSHNTSLAVVVKQ